MNERTDEAIARDAGLDMVSWYVGTRQDIPETTMRLYAHAYAAALATYPVAYRDVLDNGLPATLSYEAARGLKIINATAGIAARAHTVAYYAAKSAAAQAAATAVVYETLAA
jgi:hypothetical protein